MLITPPNKKVLLIGLLANMYILFVELINHAPFVVMIMYFVYPTRIQTLASRLRFGCFSMCQLAQQVRATPFKRIMLVRLQHWHTLVIVTAITIIFVRSLEGQVRYSKPQLTSVFTISLFLDKELTHLLYMFLNIMQLRLYYI